MFIFLSFRFGIDFFFFSGFVVVVIINFLLYYIAIKSIILKSSSSVTLTDVVLLFIMIWSQSAVVLFSVVMCRNLFYKLRISIYTLSVYKKQVYLSYRCPFRFSKAI